MTGTIQIVGFLASEEIAPVDGYAGLKLPGGIRVEVQLLRDKLHLPIAKREDQPEFTADDMRIAGRPSVLETGKDGEPLFTEGPKIIHRSLVLILRICRRGADRSRVRQIDDSEISPLSVLPRYRSANASSIQVSREKDTAGRKREDESSSLKQPLTHDEVKAVAEMRRSFPVDLLTVQETYQDGEIGVGGKWSNA